VPGKQAIAALNTELQRSLRVSVTAAQIIRHLPPADTAADLRSILGDLDIFARLTIRGLPINHGLYEFGPQLGPGLTLGWCRLTF
jgi:hypothetical protein